MNATKRHQISHLSDIGYSWTTSQFFLGVGTRKDVLRHSTNDQSRVGLHGHVGVVFYRTTRKKSKIHC